MRHLLSTIAIGLCVSSSAALAQDRPFVFSLATSRETAARQVRVDYEIGVGDQALHQQTTNGPEQRIGMQVTAGRMTFIGHIGMSDERTSYQSSQQAEAWVSVLARGGSPNALAVGGGVLHEAGGVNVLLARLVAGREGPAARLHGNFLFQKPLSTGRDSADVITSMGWAARVTPIWSVGIETIAEDLEGFWEADEAEGGARILVGPSVHIAPPHKRWQLSFAGGPTFHPAVSDRTSAAIRDLPAATGRRGYAMRTTFACRF